MKLGLRERALQLRSKPRILHDERISASLPGLPCEVDGAGELAWQDFHVQRDVHGDAAQMRVIACLLEILQREIVGVAPCIELAESQIDCISSGAYGSVQAFDVSRGR